MSILLAGATGLIGGQVAKIIPADRLTLLLRRPLEAASLAQKIGDTASWPGLIADVKPVVAISTLGTTIRQAGSQEAFRAVDHDLLLSVAKAAKQAGAAQFIMVSSVGASAAASNFYLKTKGEAEEAVKALGFDRVDILRPGLLRGDRSGPTRWGERAAIMVSPLTDFLTPAVLDQYRSIEARTVAKAIVALAGSEGQGTHIHHNHEMTRLAGL